MIGLVYDNPNPYHIIGLQNGVLSACRETGFGLQIHPCDATSPLLADELIELVQRSRIAGLVLTAPISERAELIEALEQAGVSDDSRVVLYGDVSVLPATRAYFTLDYLGHGDHASLLDGGLPKWSAESRPLSKEQPAAQMGSFTPRPRPEVAMARLDEAQHEAMPLDRFAVGLGVVHVGDRHLDVDDRLRRQAGHRGRADVLDAQRQQPE